MKKAQIIVLILLVLTLSSNGQKSSNYLGFSVNFGNKSNYSFAGIAVQARLIKHIDIDFGGSYSFFHGYGYSGGINLVPLNTKFQPFIGASYGKTFGVKSYDITEGEDKTSYYRISPIEFVYAKIGLMYGPEKEKGDFGDLVFLTFTLFYRKAISDYSIELVDGPPYIDKEYLNSKMEDGIGFSLSLIVLFGGN